MGKVKRGVLAQREAERKANEVPPKAPPTKFRPTGLKRKEPTGPEVAQPNEEARAMVAAGKKIVVINHDGSPVHLDG